MYSATVYSATVYRVQTVYRAQCTVHRAVGAPGAALKKIAVCTVRPALSRPHLMDREPQHSLYHFGHFDHFGARRIPAGSRAAGTNFLQTTTTCRLRFYCRLFCWSGNANRPREPSTAGRSSRPPRHRSRQSRPRAPESAGNRAGFP